MCTTPNETCLRSFFLKVFFLPFSGAAAPPAAAAGFAIFVLRRRWFVVRKSTGACSSGVGRRPTTDDGFLGFCRRLLLVRDRSFTRALAGASVRVRTLPADRKVASMAKTAIGADFNEPLDAH